LRGGKLGRRSREFASKRPSDLGDRERSDELGRRSLGRGARDGDESL
jgi:hypothetical protein